ncbi:release factor glutamine methyltransferase [Formivibrio citricus]|uniref:Release factor glutamine methyltransferase n=1 Tax=Formivibrio citricus TaxID=83765 RepID=A0A1I4VQK3_9NEIS|nr:peptide chain release factor N(5)-glutamine methyltransferase [Formivibrio citricus]SFN03460.1 release factor glutamine methyltransferase [Formivibrio citricus]
MPQSLTYAALLRQSGLDRSDALALFCHATGHNRAWLIAHDRDEVLPEHAAVFHSLAERRRAGEPVAYLTGEREFYGRPFAVSPAVLIPRPETELLVELALARAPQGAKVLDLGCGSGCIPVTLKLERPDLQVTAVDISAPSLVMAQGNATRLGAAVRFIESDWFGALAGESFELIVSNPPYIEQHDPHLQQGDLRFEPRHALTDEADGLAHLRRIVAQAPVHLTPGGWLLFEHGWDQGPGSRALLEAAGFAEVQTWTDLAGLDRVSGGRKG